MPVVAAQAHAQAFQRIVVQAQGRCVAVGHFVFVGARGALVHELLGRETLGIERGEQLHLVAPVLHAAPERQAELVPRIGEYRGLALGTVAGEEVERLVVGVAVAHGHDDFASPHVQHSAEKLLVQPELLDGHLATLFGFGFVFARFFGFYFNGSLVAAVLKLYFGAQGPTAAEVEAEVERHMGQVELAMAFVVLVAGGGVVAVETLAVEIARHNGLAITAQTQALEEAGLFLLFGGVWHLRRGSRHGIHRHGLAFRSCHHCHQHHECKNSESHIWACCFPTAKFGLLSAACNTQKWVFLLPAPCSPLPTFGEKTNHFRG